jgi:hypothetical protein
METPSIAAIAFPMVTVDPMTSSDCTVEGSCGRETIPKVDRESESAWNERLGFEFVNAREVNVISPPKEFIAMELPVKVAGGVMAILPPAVVTLVQVTLCAFLLPMVNDWIGVFAPIGPLIIRGAEALPEELVLKVTAAFSTNPSRDPNVIEALPPVSIYAPLATYTGAERIISHLFVATPVVSIL